MLCNDVMKNDVRCVSTSDTAREAAVAMRDANIGFLPVCDERGYIVGTITDRDLAVRVVANGLESSTRVADVMSAGVVACDPSDSLERAEALMREHRVARVVCLDGDGLLVGVISLSDVAQFARDEDILATMRDVTKREAA